MQLLLEEHLEPEVRRDLKAFLQLFRATPERYRDIYAVVNQKGGAGKTTTTLTLGAIWAGWGLRVRAIDADPQLGSASFWLPPQWSSSAKPSDLRAVYFGEATVDEATAPTVVPGLNLVPSDKTLGQVEYANLPDGNLALRAALAESLDPHDITLIDCRPSLGVLTVSALTAATRLLLPLGASGMDVPGLIELSDTRETVRRRLNPDLVVEGVVVCHDSSGTNLSRDIHKQLEADYPGALRWSIPRSVRVEEAPFAHEPLTTFAPSNPATKAYVRLAAALLLRRTGGAA